MPYQHVAGHVQRQVGPFLVRQSSSCNAFLIQQAIEGWEKYLLQLGIISICSNRSFEAEKLSGKNHLVYYIGVNGSPLGSWVFLPGVTKGTAHQLPSQRGLSLQSPFYQLENWLAQVQIDACCFFYRNFTLTSLQKLRWVPWVP